MDELQHLPKCEVYSSVLLKKKKKKLSQFYRGFGHLSADQAGRPAGCQAKHHLGQAGRLTLNQL